MKIVEISCVVDVNGKFTLPHSVISDMGLVPGDSVSIAYITQEYNPVNNNYKEFFISPKGIMGLDDENEMSEVINLSAGLLTAAGIEPDSNVIIECCEGTITITSTDVIEEEMRQAINIIAAAKKGIATMFSDEQQL